MSKILDWIKKHVWQTILIGLAAFFVPLIFVHVAYRISAVSPWFASTWEAGELIAYIAGFEAFIGTVSLGIIASHQNENAKNINERLLNIETLSRRPYLAINKVLLNTCFGKDVFEKGTNYFTQKGFNNYLNLGEAHYFSISFENVTPNYLDFEFISLKITSPLNKFSLIEYEGLPLNCSFSTYKLNTKEGISFNFVVSNETLEKTVTYRITIELVLRNIFGESYSESISFFIIGNLPDYFSYHSIKYEFKYLNS